MAVYNVAYLCCGAQGNTSQLELEKQRVCVCVLLAWPPISGVSPVNGAEGLRVTGGRWETQLK